MSRGIKLAEGFELVADAEPVEVTVPAELVVPYQKAGRRLDLVQPGMLLRGLELRQVPLVELPPWVKPTGQLEGLAWLCLELAVYVHMGVMWTAGPRQIQLPPSLHSHVKLTGWAGLFETVTAGGSRYHAAISERESKRRPMDPAEVWPALVAGPWTWPEVVTAFDGTEAEELVRSAALREVFAAVGGLSIRDQNRHLTSAAGSGLLPEFTRDDLGPLAAAVWREAVQSAVRAAAFDELPQLVLGLLPSNVADMAAAS